MFKNSVMYIRKLYYSDCTKVQALEAASLHPAQVLGITNRKGTLDYGTDADLVILDDELKIMATYIAGECVWQEVEGVVSVQQIK